MGWGSGSVLETLMTWMDLWYASLSVFVNDTVR